MVYRREGELTDLALPGRIVRQACLDCKARDGPDKEFIRYIDKEFIRYIEKEFIRYVDKEFIRYVDKEQRYGNCIHTLDMQTTCTLGRFFGLTSHLANY